MTPTQRCLMVLRIGLLLVGALLLIPVAISFIFWLWVLAMSCLVGSVLLSVLYGRIYN